MALAEAWVALAGTREARVGAPGGVAGARGSASGRMPGGCQAGPSRRSAGSQTASALCHRTYRSSGFSRSRWKGRHGAGGSRPERPTLQIRQNLVPETLDHGSLGRPGQTTPLRDLAGDCRKGLRGIRPHRPGADGHNETVVGESPVPLTSWAPSRNILACAASEARRPKASMSRIRSGVCLYLRPAELVQMVVRPGVSGYSAIRGVRGRIEGAVLVAKALGCGQPGNTRPDRGRRHARVWGLGRAAKGSMAASTASPMAGASFTFNLSLRSSSSRSSDEGDFRAPVPSPHGFVIAGSRRAGSPIGADGDDACRHAMRDEIVARTGGNAAA